MIPGVALEYVAFDLETTGLDPKNDDIVEIALVRFSGGKARAEWSTLVKPVRKVPLWVLRLTGIDPSQLEHAPSVHEILDVLKELIGDLPLVGHNCGFDITFLGRFLEGLGDRPYYDTLELSRILLPGLSSYRLSSLCETLGIPLVSAHRALDDARASGYLFEVLKEKASSVPSGVSSFVRTVMGPSWMSRDIFGPATPGVELRVDVTPPAHPNTTGSVLAAGPAAADRGKERYFFGEAAGPSQAGPTLFVRSDLEMAVYSVLVEHPAAESAEREAEPDVWSRTVAVEAPGTPESLLGVLSACALASAKTASDVILAYFDGQTGSRLEKSVVSLAGPERETVWFLPVPRRFLCLARWRVLENLVQAGVLEEMDAETRRALAMIASWLSATKAGLDRELRMSAGLYQVFSELRAEWYPDCKSRCSLAELCFCERAKEPGHPGVVVAQVDDLLSGYLSRSDRDRRLVLLNYHRVLEWSDRKADVFEPGRAKTLVKTGGRVFEEIEAWIAGCVTRGEKVLSGSRGIDLPEGLQKLLVEGRRILNEYRETRRRQDEELKEKLSAVGVPGYLPFAGRDVAEAEETIEVLDRLLSPRDNRAILADERYTAGTRAPVLRWVWVKPGRELARALGSRMKCSVLVSSLAGFLTGRRGYEELLGLPESLTVVRGRGEPERGKLLTVFVDGLPVAREDPDERTLAFLVDVAGAVREGCLILAPSSSKAEILVDKLTPSLEEKGILTVLAAGPGKWEEYLNEPDTVVVSRLSPFEEEDFSGARCVLLLKLPFSPPRPEDEVREQEVRKAGGDYFRDVTLTGVLSRLAHLVDALRNGAGPRVVVVLDSRARPAGSSYGNEVFRVLAADQYVVCPPSAAVGRISSWISLRERNVPGGFV